MPDDNEGLPQEKVDAEWQGIIAGFGEAPRMPAANDDVPGAN